jgi:hypothetical protein
MPHHLEIRQYFSSSLSRGSEGEIGGATMACNFCQANLPEDAHFCGKCGRSQNVVVVATEESIHAEQGNATLSHAPPEAIRQVLEAQWMKQQEALTILRNEMDLKFTSQLIELSQQQKDLDERLNALKAEPQPNIDLPRRFAMKILIVLSLAAIGLVWIFYSLVIYLPNNKFDALSIISTTLTLIGSFYLAYDLLGRHHGLLRWLTLAITCGVAAIIVLEPILLLAIWFKGTPYVLQGIMTEGLLGATIGIIVGMPNRTVKQMLFSPKGCAIGSIIGILFWILFFIPLVPGSSLEWVIPYLEFALVLGVVPGGLIGGFRGFFSYKAFDSKSIPSFFSWKNSLIGFILGICVWAILFYWFVIRLERQNSVFEIILVIGVSALLGSTSAIAAGIARFSFWWVNNLPERVLGTYGLVLALIGTVLPMIQPIYNLLKTIGS